MRTAAFGHGISGLTMCILEHKMGGDWFGIEEPEGILVPFAIVAAMRKRVVEVGIRSISDTKTTFKAQ